MARLAPELFLKQYCTLDRIHGPLLFVRRTLGVRSDELVEVSDPQGELRTGKVLEVDGDLAIVQVFEGTRGLDLERTRVRFRGEVARVAVSPAMLGRVLGPRAEPIDGGPAILAEATLDINGAPINPSVRQPPNEFIQTGISAIDGLNALTRGQKLPIFSGAGLPANRLAAQIAAQAIARGMDGAPEPFAVVFVAIGITHREVSFFVDRLQQSGAMERTVLFLNQASEPNMLRLLVPRSALTVAEYLAFQCGRHVLVIMTDMTNYCEALRELAAAREEVPGPRGYPGYMFTDLAMLYERAGRIEGKPGSLTQLLILSMPDDDLSHPIPDLTGYITEGQLVLSRELDRRGVYPPIDILPSLSRRMKAGIGEGKTRADHLALANQIYALYARGRDLRQQVTILGEAALSTEDRLALAFADSVEGQLVGQGQANRSLPETLDLAWQLLKPLPRELLKLIPEALLERYHSAEAT